ncbi:hypothetical protein M1558_01980 [Candidatus Parvarchaeota archaeon]|nr:hypothetical protein [Candidatus Parvarchaeota archaeon]
MVDINIKEVIEDKKTWFNIKRFNIGNINFEKPEKSIDFKNLTQFDSEVNNFPFVESTKSVKFETIEKLYDSSSEKDWEVKSFFGCKNWLKKPVVLNLTFNFDPLTIDNTEKKKALIGFLDNYYSYSNLMLSIPNIKITKYNEKTKTIEKIINLNNYKTFVDFAYENLETKNNKPIFVPISLRLSQKELQELINYYIKKERFYYWVDFEGKAINSQTIGKLRFLFRSIKSLGYYNKTLTYFTNINREIIANSQDENSPASDVLSTLCGANVVGVNKKPRKIIPIKKPSQEDLKRFLENKIRLLDSNSYYYKKAEIKTINEKICVIKNAIKLKNEFSVQAENLLKSGGDIANLLDKKDMLKSYLNGKILRDIESKKEVKNLTNWY